jgi:hypothetical protein
VQVGVVAAAGGAAVDLTAELDRRVQYGGAVPLAWTADSSAILFPAADHGKDDLPIYATGLAILQRRVDSAFEWQFRNVTKHSWLCQDRLLTTTNGFYREANALIMN